MAQRVANKIEQDLKAAIRKNAQELIDNLPKSAKQEIGDVIVDEMKDLISKGISPIEGKGRFPAYKWAAARKDVVDTVNRFTKGQKGKDVRALKSEAKRAYSNKYPFSVQNEFPDKRPRPVNLFLSGEFMESLKSKVRNGQLFVGFFEKRSTQFEQGHREGVNGQPKRPIIPIDDERFSTTIVRKVELKVREIFRRKNKT